MKINEIFYSIQGEGYHTGTPAVFIRFSGCNLKCPFCDTNFKEYVDMTEEEIISRVSAYPSKLVVITGGEPTLQLTHSLVHKLHRIGRYVAVETNGIVKSPTNVDWITVSPKQQFVGINGRPLVTDAGEVKVVFDGLHDVTDYGIKALHYYVQPCDTGDDKKNKEIVNKCIEFIKKNPKWKLSLQTQKILNVR